MTPFYQQMDNILLDFITNLNDDSDITYYNNEFSIKLNSFLVNHMLTPGITVSDEIRLLAENTRNANQLFNIIKKSNLILAGDIIEINTLVDNSIKEINKIKNNLL
jgi:hypothetical protein